MPDNCIFCKIIAGEIPAKVVFEDDQVVVIEDLAPQAPVHLLIFPRKHVRTTLDLAVEDNALVGHIYQVANQMAKELDIADDGFRIVNNCNEGAGQSIWHIHFHVLGGRNMTWPPG
ncbi:MAG: histidine triad nucleotide-binding protein [Desulfuromonadales bacterium]|nr:histidine triad nucleotide-binding protein [Desulfuromonadales bacterium]